jgi:hypothetical protein
MFLSSLSFSQGISVKATRQHWAGGVCCVTGTKYTVAIRGSLDSLNNVEFKYAMIDGNAFSINKPIDKKGEWEIYHYEFNISIDKTREKITDEKITVVDKNLVQENYLLISYNNQDIKIPIKEIEDLFYLAYP